MATKEKFTTQMCEYLHVTPKYLATRINWQAEGSTVKFRAKVITIENGIGLDLHGYFLYSPRYKRMTWGFNLSCRKNLVRQYDLAKRHWNQPGDEVKGPHKHKYCSSLLPRYAYKPDPPITESDANFALLDFLKEENISIPVDYQHYMFPATMSIGEQGRLDLGEMPQTGRTAPHFPEIPE